MALIKLPHFGQLDSTSLEEYYDVDVPFQETEIQIDLNFDNKTIDPKRLETVKQFIENIRIHDLNNKKYIESDYKSTDGDTVRLYLEHHLEELGEEELADLFNLDTRPNERAGQLLKKLHLVRVGLYPDSDNQFAIFDYSIGKDLTQYLVVINTDENGNLDYLTMES
jgi:hypothetical protein